MKEDLQNKFNDFEGRYDFSETEWQGLAIRLDKHRFWQRGIWALIGGLLLLALVGSNVALWQQNQALNKRMSGIDFSKSTTEKVVNPTLLAQTDTLSKRTIIYQYDTIYRKITIVQEQLSLSNGSHITPPQTPYSTTITNKTVLTSPDLTTTLQRVPTTNLDNNNPQKSLEKSLDAENTPPQYLGEKMLKNEANSSKTKEIQPFPATDTPSNSVETVAPKPILVTVDTATSEPIVTAKRTHTKDSIVLKTPPFDALDINKKEDTNNGKADEKAVKKHPKYTFKMLPIYVGATVAVPIWTESAIIGLNANQYGLKTEIVATDNVRFFGEMAYTKNGESKSTDLAALPDEVNVPTAEPNLSFKYWEIYGLKSLNYALGVQYRLGKNDKIRPYLAAAFNGTTTLPFEVKFEYKDKTSGMEREYKRQVANNITHLNRLYTAFGVHWQPFSRGQLSAETYLSTPLTSDKALTPLQIGVKIGMFYFIQ